ncbi:hypothetical protein OE165_28495, partial [Escherichia coli]|uniref:hypothetical protein n=1 Tax=Escherichia coli TaxID=562 RepID=UPI0021F2B9AF
YYYRAKYKFIAKYPKIPKWFVFSFLVIFLDAWHFSKFISVLCFFGLVALYDLPMALVGIVIYNICFTLIYKK